jgi:RND family efflux transporter MFP subunit
MMRNKWVWILVIVVLAAGGGVLWWREGPVSVGVVTPTRGPAVEAIYATGTVEPSVMMPIAPRTAGRLAELNVDEGSKVRKGQVLARLDDADLTSTVEELAARARFAREQHQRTQDLVKKGFLAQLELERTRSDLEAADAAAKRSRTQRDFMALTAPADGLIIRRDGEIGQFIPVNQPVFYLSCCAPLRVTAEVDEEDIPRVRVGQKVVLRADALAGQTFEGQVSDITPKGDPVARSYRVRVKLADPGQLQVGMTVDANLIVAERSNALLVPTGAIQSGNVWVVNDGKLHRQAVRTGVAGTVRTEIVDGLAPDASIVAIPGDGLRDGRSVRAHTAPSTTTAKAP